MDPSPPEKSAIPLIDVNGHMVPYYLIDVNKVRQGMLFKADPEDVILVSYMRSGTHWVAYLIWSILHDGEAIPELRDFNRKEAPFIENVGTPPGNMLSPRFFKTHMACHLKPYNTSRKKIWNTRNPFDCCVSNYYFNKEVAENMRWENPNFDDYFSLFLKGQVPVGNYFDHFKSCFQHRNDKNVLHVTYESMKANPTDTLLKINFFLGEHYYKRITENETLTRRILQNTCYDSMKENVFFVPEEPGQIYASSDDMSPSLDGDSAKRKKVFLRKGIIGDWKNHFSDDQEKRMRDWIQENLNSEELRSYWKELGYDQL